MSAESSQALFRMLPCTRGSLPLVMDVAQLLQYFLLDLTSLEPNLTNL